MLRLNLISALTIPHLLIVAPLLFWSATPFAQDARTGILLMAHGGKPEWNARVVDIANSVDRVQPVEVAFGMASRSSLQAAADRLVARQVTRIVAVPLFVSSHSSVVESTAFLLGLRRDMPPDLRIFAAMNHGPAVAPGHHGSGAGGAEDNMRPIVSPVPIAMTGALDRHPLAADVLTSRARSISTSPDREAVILVAHGPVPDADNQLWLADMAVLADQLRVNGSFRAVDYLTVRDDAPTLSREAAAAELRKSVEGRVAEGLRVLVVPLLMSFDGIEPGIRRRLEGLEYVMTSQGLIPDDRLAGWVLSVAAGAARH